MAALNIFLLGQDTVQAITCTVYLENAILTFEENLKHKPFAYV